MKPIQIIAFDLDGTVLDSKKHLSDRNRNTLAACAKMGIYVVPTTGRSAAGIIPEIKGIPGVRYAITTNGGTITDLNFPHQHGVLNLENSIFQPLKKA